jgi:integrase
MPRKRANGEGNIRKRKDGRWEGRYTAGRNPETGKPITKNVLAKTQSECKEKLKRAVEENSKLDVMRSGTYTVGQWLNLWYENYAAPTIRETTAAYYKNYIDHHIVPKLGDIPLHKLTTLQIQQFYRQAKESGRVQRYEGMTDLSLSDKTIRGMHAMFRQCLEQAVAERLITANPANGCKLPKKEKREMQVIPSEKIGDYLRAAEEHGVLPMFYLELTTGLHRGELVALLWEDLDIKEQSIRVTKSVLRINGELKVSPPKTQNSVRKVYIPKEAVDLLVEEHKRHPFNKYMFPSPVTGDMYGPDCVGRIHKKLLARAGIKEKIRFHDLRHTFATISLKNGVDVKTISHILGHYSAGFTLDTYTHVTGDMKKEAAKRSGEVIAI